MLETCAIEAIPLNETIELIKVTPETHGDCVNKKPIDDFTECVGICQSSTTFDKSMFFFCGRRIFDFFLQIRVPTRVNVLAVKLLNSSIEKWSWFVVMVIHLRKKLLCRLFVVVRVVPLPDLLKIEKLRVLNRNDSLLK